MTESPERRAEELRRRLSVAAGQVVQQREFFLDIEEVLGLLLSENRQVREAILELPQLEAGALDTYMTVRAEAAEARVKELELKLGWFVGHSIDLEEASSAQSTIAALEARIEELNRAFESELITPLQTRWVEMQQALMTALWLMWEAKAEKRALRQDLDRISAEREAYREFIEEVSKLQNTTTMQAGDSTYRTTTGEPTQLALRARRILAENDQ